MGYDCGDRLPFDFEPNGSNLNQMEFHLVQNRKENCHDNHIPFNVKRNGNIVHLFSVCTPGRYGNGRRARSQFENISRRSFICTIYLLYFSDVRVISGNYDPVIPIVASLSGGCTPVW